MVPIADWICLGVYGKDRLSGRKRTTAEIKGGGASTGKLGVRGMGVNGSEDGAGRGQGGHPPVSTGTTPDTKTEQGRFRPHHFHWSRCWAFQETGPVNPREHLPTYHHANMPALPSVHPFTYCELVHTHSAFIGATSSRAAATWPKESGS